MEGEGDGGGSTTTTTTTTSDQGPTQAEFNAAITGLITGQVPGEQSTTTDSEGNTTVSPGSASRGPQSNSEAMQAARAAVEALQQQAAEQQARAEQAQAKANEAKARAEEAQDKANNSIEQAREAINSALASKGKGEYDFEGKADTASGNLLGKAFPGASKEAIETAVGIAGVTAGYGSGTDGVSKGLGDGRALKGATAAKSFLQGQQDAANAAKDADAAQRAADQAAREAEAAKDKAQKAADLLAQVEDIFNELENGGEYTEDGVTVDSEDMDSEGHFGTNGFGDYTVPVTDNASAHYTTHVWDSAYDSRTGLMYIMVGKQTIDRGDIFQ